MWLKLDRSAVIAGEKSALIFPLSYILVATSFLTAQNELNGLIQPNPLIQTQKKRFCQSKRFEIANLTINQHIVS